MNRVKHRRAEALSTTARFPVTFAAILAAIPERLRDRMTAADLTAVVEFGHRQSVHGYSKGVGESLGAGAEAAPVRGVEQARPAAAWRRRLDGSRRRGTKSAFALWVSALTGEPPQRRRTQRS